MLQLSANIKAVRSSFPLALCCPVLLWNPWLPLRYQVFLWQQHNLCQWLVQSLLGLLCTSESSLLLTLREAHHGSGLDRSVRGWGACTGPSNSCQQWSSSLHILTTNHWPAKQGVKTLTVRRERWLPFYEEQTHKQLLQTGLKLWNAFISCCWS